MTFISNKDLPERVQHRLPEHAQDIYREAYNKALEHYKDPKRLKFREPLEEACNKAAWAVVKEKCAQKGGKWVVIH